MDDSQTPTELSEIERERALARYRIVQPFLEGRSSLTAIAREQGFKLRTLQHWVARYRQQGLRGLARQKRSDADDELIRCSRS